MSDSDVDQAAQDALKASDHVIEDPPAWLPDPLRRALADLTFAEWHAALLGLLGLPAGAGVAIGLTPFIAPVVIALVAISVGLRKAPDSFPASMLVTRREPWYFTTVLVVAMTVGYWTLRLVGV